MLVSCFRLSLNAMLISVVAVMNLSHVIHEFSFGPFFPRIVQPLDNSVEIATASQSYSCSLPASMLILSDRLPYLPILHLSE